MAFEQEQQAKKEGQEEAEELKEGEMEMDFDSSAYEMLHRTNVEWPCLSLDVLVRERCTENRTDRSWFPKQVGNALTPENSSFNKRLNINIHNEDQFPMTVYFAAGSQNPI